MKTLRMATNFNHPPTALAAPRTISGHFAPCSGRKAPLQGSWCVFKASASGLNEPENQNLEVCRG